MRLKKIFDYDFGSFLEMKKRKFYVFEKHIVFRHKDGIYAVLHFRNGDLSVIDSFEQEYTSRGLKYNFIGDLGSKDINKIRERLSLLKD